MDSATAPLLPDPQVREQARLSRDPRFDGLFFTAVRSTGIYCRPVCPAPTPKRENVCYFGSAAAAEAAGYRPCLRCRPELPPEDGARRRTAECKGAARAGGRLAAVARVRSDPPVARGGKRAGNDDEESGMMTFQYHASPVGALLLAADGSGLRRIAFPQARRPAKPGTDWREGDDAVLRETRRQLDEYFAGTRHSFALPLAPQGTPFQLAVWHALATIPYGDTMSYARLAARVGRPNAVRAVGAANGRNPLPIVLPCHRVIGADGNLTGFGGGLPVKRFLLELEGALAGPGLLATATAAR